MEFLLLAMKFLYEYCLNASNFSVSRMLSPDRPQVKEMRRSGITCVIKTKALSSPRGAGQQVFIICGNDIGHGVGKQPVYR